MLNPFIKGRRHFAHLVTICLCFGLLAACATSPKEVSGDGMSASERLARIKKTGTSKVISAAEDGTEKEDLTSETPVSMDESDTNLDNSVVNKSETPNQEQYDFSSTEYTLPKAKKRERPLPEVSKDLKDAYKDALKAMNRSLKDKEFDEALELFKAIEAQHPDFSGSSTNIGMIYMHQEKFEEAEAAFKKALEINNENEYAHNNLGLAYRELGKFPEAKQSYQSAIELNPKYAEAHYNLGILAELYLQDLELAIQSFEHYKLAHRSKDEQVDTWLVDLRYRLKTQKQIEAQNQAQAQQSQTEEPTNTDTDVNTDNQITTEANQQLENSETTVESDSTDSVTSVESTDSSSGDSKSIPAEENIEASESESP